MKCVNCNKDAKKKDRDSNGGRCPSCHHSFVADPAKDGFTDMAIKSAQDAVSSNGTFYFSKNHLKYQLQRKLKKKIRICHIASTVLLVIFLPALMLTFIRGGGFIAVTVISAILLLISFGAKTQYKNNIGNLDALLERWIRINPHEKLLSSAKYQANFGKVNNSHLDDISFERVLICDRNESVDFFLSNLFHFHYSCPVLGGDGYPQGIYEDMLRRLKQNPDLKVFLLHDYSPAGYAFVRRMKTDAKWFGGTQRYNIIDLGLNVGQKKLFKAMTIKQVDRNGKIKESAEVSLFQPAALIALCGAAINEGVPLDLITTAAIADSSSGGYG